LRIIGGLATSPGTGDIHPILFNAGLDVIRGLLWLTVLGTIAFALPNSNRIGESLRQWVLTRPATTALLTGLASMLGIFLVLVNSTRDSVSAFIYFNF